MANIEELKSLFVNNNLGYQYEASLNSVFSRFLMGDSYFSSTADQNSQGKIYALRGYNGAIFSQYINLTATYKNVFCIKK